MSLSHIHFHVDDAGLALLTINRPEKLNALNHAVIEDLRRCFGRVQSEPAIRAVILTGAGERAFVAGADISELADAKALQAEVLSASGQSVFRMLETMRKPSVAAINGYAMGGGLELAMCCTVRIAVPEARLGQPEVKLGLVPGYGGTQRLPRLIGKGRALDMLLTGDPIDAAEAQRIGLVSYVKPQAELLPFSRSWLLKVLANGPLAVGLVMQAVESGMDGGIAAGLQFEAAAFGLTAASDDCREGIRAFLEKRKPVFAGR